MTSGLGSVLVVLAGLTLLASVYLIPPRALGYLSALRLYIAHHVELDMVRAGSIAAAAASASALRGSTERAPMTDSSTSRAARARSLRTDSPSCWKAPAAALEAPFDANMASLVWTRPLQTAFGPLDDVAPSRRARDWPAARRKLLIEQLPDYDAMRALRYKTCAVVGSSPELLLYEDGARIDAHDAVFRANLASTRGFELHAGNRTTVRVVNPVESILRARGKGLGGTRQGGDATIVTKTQDPPSIRDPSDELGKFLRERQLMRSRGRGARPATADYLSRRRVIELCNFLFLMSGVALDEPALAPYAVNLSKAADVFGASARADRWRPWHPMGTAIPQFSPVHCSTGTVLLTEALLLCDKVRLYGFHVCECKRACGRDRIDERNHYYDRAPTKLFARMLLRYTSHLRFYHRLRESCDYDFDIARLEHCDRPPARRDAWRR